ncbi:SPOR domain-containing protein [Hwanghaeella sp.]|uniref:SPOR domain-containing protein n=1 Tax=Hwanghaeella sp. TaxID=2605943 RepID=UPI003CCC0111
MTSELDALEKELADLEDGGKGGGSSKRKLGTAPLVVAVLAVCALGGLVYYAYDQGIREGTEVAAPLLAPEGPAKVKPEDPGGLAVPHRDKTVYDVVQGGASNGSQEQVETLLPPPEEPMVPPATQPAVQGGAPAGEPVVTATNKLNETEKPSVPQISAPPLPAEGLAAPEAPATLSEQTEEKIEAAQEQASQDAASAAKLAETDTVATITPPPAEPKPEPVAEPPAPQPTAEAAPEPKAVAALTDGALSEKWRVQVGAVRSQDAAEKEWARIVGKNKDLLGDLTLQVQEVDVTGKGTFFRIRGGPMADKAAAESLCGKLKAGNIPCIPVRPGA